MPVDTSLSSLVINRLTTAQYQQLVEDHQINENELYLTTDVNYPTQQDMETALATKQDVLTAGSGISISNNVISSTQTSAEWGNITGTLSDQTDLNNVLSTKANVATTLAGYGIVDSYTKNETDLLLVNKQDELSQNQLNAVNSGITSDKVNTYDGYAAQINAKADINDVYTKDEVNTYVADNAVQTVTTGETRGTIKVDGVEVAVKDLSTMAYEDKANYSTTSEMNSAINTAVSVKANSADVYTKTDIDNTYATISSLTNHTNNTTIHVTASDKTNWNGKATIVFREWS